MLVFRAAALMPQFRTKFDVEEVLVSEQNTTVVFEGCWFPPEPDYSS